MRTFVILFLIFFGICNTSVLAGDSNFNEKLDLSFNSLARVEPENLDKKFKLYDQGRSNTSFASDEWLKVKRSKGVYQEDASSYQLSNRAMTDEIDKSSKYRGIDINRIGEGSTEGIGISGSIKLP